MKTRFRQRSALVTAMAIGAGSLLGLAGLAGAFTPPNPDIEVAKVTICHRTNSNSNPYIVNEPAADGDVSGHSGHVGSDDPGPVWNPTLKALHIKWGDIIPPFKHSGGDFPGLNWTAEGQAIYANDCVPPGPPVVQEFGTLALTKAVVNPNGVGVPASFTLNVNCDDEVVRGPYVVANTGNVGSPVQITDIEAGSTCIVTEDGAFNPTFDPPAANTTGVLVDANQTVAVTVTNTFAPPAAAAVVTPTFTG